MEQAGSAPGTVQIDLSEPKINKVCKEDYLPHYVYILHSESSNKHYVGISLDPDNRLRQHLKGQCKSTKTSKDWKRIALLKVANRYEALKLESYTKTKKINLATELYKPETLNKALKIKDSYFQSLYKPTTQ